MDGYTKFMGLLLGEHGFIADANSGSFDLSASTSTFKTPTGAFSLNGDTTLAAGKNLTGAAGAGAVDLSAMTGTFKTPTGAATLSGDTTVASGKTLAVTTADKLTVGGLIVPQEIEVSVRVGAAALMVDHSFFIATQAYQVTKVKFVHAVAESTASTLLVQVVKDTGTDAPGAGTDLLTNNTNAGFDCKATANTVQSGTLTATAASLQLAAGDRLSLDFSAGATELVGVTITVTLKRI